MFSGVSTPSSSAHERKKRQMTRNLSHMKLSTQKAVTPTSAELSCAILHTPDVAMALAWIM
jgi:hypothetical protein